MNRREMLRTTVAGVGVVLTSSTMIAAQTTDAVGYRRPRKGEAWVDYYCSESVSTRTGDTRLMIRLKSMMFECEDLGVFDILADPHQLSADPAWPLYHNAINALVEKHKDDPLFQIMEINDGFAHKWAFRACDDWWRQDRVPEWEKAKLAHRHTALLKQTLLGFWDTSRKAVGEDDETFVLMEERDKGRRQATTRQGWLSVLRQPGLALWSSRPIGLISSCSLDKNNLLYF